MRQIRRAGRPVTSESSVVEHQHVAGTDRIIFLAALLFGYITFSRHNGGSGTPECRTLSASNGLARRRRRRRIGRDCCATATGELRSAFVAKISKPVLANYQ